MRTCLALCCLVALSACGSSHPDCGACPKSYSCSTANGLPACRAPSGVPLLRHLFVILMENTSLSTLQASARAPYLASLAAKAAISTNHHGVSHPSLPNYLALISGDTQGVSCDCAPNGTRCSANTCSDQCACDQSAQHLGNQLDAANLKWRAYGESMGTACNLTGSSLYVPRHVPFLYFDDVQSNATRCAQQVVDYSTFAADLSSAPGFAFIAPNLVNDMHTLYSEKDKNIANGDAWLQSNLQPILDSAAYKDGGAVIVAWDEDDYSGVISADDPIPLYVLSPYVKGGVTLTRRTDHYSLLATIEDALALPRLGNAASATTLAEAFNH